MRHPSDIIGNEKRVLARLLGGAYSTEHAGDWIGPYQLIERLGEGGFGIVWRAEQTDPVQREVALKVIKRGMDTAQVLARFDHERQALASMDHPCIAAMLDAGASVDGQPYFAMELVPGQTITQWCERHRSPIHERLRLFNQVCYAVNHAHQKGVIHRDLKPSNILVTCIDTLPTPKIIDFGIAKAMRASTLAELTMLTHADEVIGTPLYMSPEQIDGSHIIDTRSDIYSLGVLLYELLTGGPPFESATSVTSNLDALKRSIREDRPVNPGTLVRARRRLEGETPAISPPFDSSMPNYSVDLDWIVIRALEKDPAHRYQTAMDLAEDVARFLAQEPIEARPPKFSYIAGRWIKRHRTIFIAACAVVFAMVTGTIVSLRQAKLARTAQALAEAQTEIAHAAEIRATENEARATREAIRAQKSTAFLTELLDRVATEIDRGRNPEALKLALADSEKHIASLGNDTRLQLQLLERVAGIYRRIGETRQLIPLLKAASEMSARISGPESETAFKAELDYLKMLRDHGDRSKVPPLVLALRTRMEAAGQRGSRLWFEVQRALVQSWLKLKKGDKALVEADEAIAEAEQQQLSASQLFGMQLNRVAALELESHFDMAETLLDQIQRDAAKRRHAEHIEEAEKALLHLLRSKKDFATASALMRQQLPALAAKHGERSPQMLEKLCELSASERDGRQTYQAITHAQAALEIARDRPADRLGLFLSLMALATAEAGAGRTTESSEHAQEALKHARDAGDNAQVESALEHLGHLHRDAQRYEEALDWFRQRAKLVISNHASTKDVVEALKNVCSTATKLRLRHEAMEAAQQAWNHLKTDPGLIEDKSFAAAIAQHAVHCFRMLRNASGGAPEPADMDAWIQLMDPSNPDVLSILRGRQESASEPLK